ncbi:transcriptional regulator [Arthrobacter crystallopoietes BAB-32]|uniref:Transcriptional regulator n=1 Tax=Arthrobacter crystallopoietes BAB-32 TaxID=1246476 RepID=N1V2P6_9MICC|nr:GAF domain-containing protein [Arthrobacter crystallopoietes]EMY34317.1 transcriptional regulator [Arthrobacter crystallopoietes BAB-32]
MHSQLQSAAGPVQRQAYTAHELLDQARSLGQQRSRRGGTERGLRAEGLRPVVRESWERSLTFAADPDSAVARLALVEDDLLAYRLDHPLAAIMPVIRKLLVDPSHDSGMLVAVGDEHGRLLWVDGDAALKRQAEAMQFVAGADWSERTVGTSAPGTALALGRGVQISGAEHFSRIVHPWSCTAVPVRDPDNGSVLGVVDITGREQAVAAHTLSLVQATVAAAEAQLRIHRLEQAARPRRTSAPAKPGTGLRQQEHGSLQLTGRDQGLLALGGRSIELSLRHTEILALLALHPAGLTAGELAALLYPDASSTTLRAELVRLRKILAALGPQAVPQSRPYRLPLPLLLDARLVLDDLQRGAHRRALDRYRGPVLPASEAPGIVRLRQEVSANLREALLSDASPATLLRYLQLPEAEYDGDAWRTVLRLLPARSPKRAAVVAHLDRIEAELA